MYVYVITNESKTVCKIGKARNVRARFGEILSRWKKNESEKLFISIALYSDRAYEVENFAHQTLKTCKIDKNVSWFAVSPEVAENAVKLAVNKFKSPNRNTDKVEIYPGRKKKAAEDRVVRRRRSTKTPASPILTVEQMRDRAAYARELERKLGLLLEPQMATYAEMAAIRRACGRDFSAIDTDEFGSVIESEKEAY
jgi:hypothetical protein